MPGLSTIDVIANAANPAFVPEWRDTQVAAQKLNLALRLRDVHDAPQIRDAFAAIVADRPDAVVVVTDTVITRHQVLVIEQAAASRLPTMYGSRRPMDDGALMCYAADARETFRSAAFLVDKILKGTKPGDLAVQSPTRFDFAINLKTAQALGLTIPQSVLQQATEIIQ